MGIVIPERSGTNTRKHTWIDGKAFRDIRSQNNEKGSEIEDNKSRTTEVTKAVRNSIEEKEMAIENNRMDSRVAHLIEAKKTILNELKTQRQNCKLRKKDVELNRAVEDTRYVCSRGTTPAR